MTMINREPVKGREVQRDTNETKDRYCCSIVSPATRLEARRLKTVIHWSSGAFSTGVDGKASSSAATVHGEV